MFRRLEYVLSNPGGAKNSWETSITTEIGPYYKVTLETLSDAPYLENQYRAFTFLNPAASTYIRLRFSARQVCHGLYDSVPIQLYKVRMRLRTPDSGKEHGCPYFMA
jgi:hypothetical protein